MPTNISFEIVDEKNERDYTFDERVNAYIKKPFSIKEHQYEVNRWMRYKETKKENGILGGILGCEMGLGKTLCFLLLTMSQKNRKNKKTPDLVICSKTVLYEWKNNIEKFFGTDCRYLVYHKDFFNNYDCINELSFNQYDIVITTYDVIKSTIKKCIRNINTNDLLLKSVNVKEHKGSKLLFKIQWNRIVFDESHILSNLSSLTLHSVLYLKSEKRWCLTGTPIRNYCSDIFSQLISVGLIRSNNTPFDKENFTYTTYQMYNLHNHVKIMTYLTANIKLPNNNIYNNSVYFNEKEQRIYNYLKGEMRTVYNGFLDKKFSFSCVLEMFLRLRQSCICPKMLWSENTSDTMKDVFAGMDKELVDYIRETKTSTKLSNIAKYIESRNENEKILVFSFFKTTGYLISDLLPNKKKLFINGDIIGKSREDALTTFKNSKEHNVLYLTYKAGSEGLNLTEASSVIITEPWYCPSVINQAVARSHRIGQEKQVNTMYFHMVNTIENRLLEICDEKSDMIDTFIGNGKKRIFRLTSKNIRYIIGE